MTLRFRVELPPSVLEVTASELEALNAGFPNLSKRATIKLLPPEDEPAKPAEPAPGPWKCLEPGCGRSFAVKHGLDIHKARGHPKRSNIPDGVI